LAGQLRKLPWSQVPVLHRSTARGHGREEVREVKVATVDGLLFPHVRQVVQIRRKRRKIGAKKWSAEAVHAVTDLPAEQAGTSESASWARGHWITENAAHWTKDVTFGEDAIQVRRHNTPVVMTAIRDIVRGTLQLASWAHTVSGRRAHSDPASTLTLHSIP
jgi:predicted transposase YbfD/YdcC